jgi:hypothetical protein
MCHSKTARLTEVKAPVLRKVTHLTAQKHAASDQSKRLNALSAFIIARNSVGTVIAICTLKRVMKQRVIKYE